jgi:hypothetical protein
MRKILKRISRQGFRSLARLESAFDAAFLVDDVPLSRPISPQDLHQYTTVADGRRLRILEIGSREVTGPSQAREKFADADYVGFDYYPGRNVDVVGDVHRLSSYFPEGETFDIIYSVACFEHFAMPWLVAVEIAKMLPVGGVLFVATHFSYAAHERPWNFFQFSDMGLRVLFSSALGFECIASGMSNPMVGRFSRLAAKELRYEPVRGLYCGSEYLGRKVKVAPAFDWNSVSIDEVVSGTTYPPPKQ